MFALAKPATTDTSVKVNNAGTVSNNPTSDESANDLDSSVNGIVQCPDGRWAMYKNGKVDTTCTSIEQNKYGWWRVKDGYVDFEAQGIYQNRYGWWKTTNGKVTFNEFGLFENENGTWRVEFSKVNFKANSIYQGKDGWYKTTNGKVTFDETGVFQNQFGWWYVNDSKVDFDFTGISSNSFGKWYINNGKVDFTKIGKVQFEGKTYVVAFGKVLLCLTPDEQEPLEPEERLELKSDYTELLANEEATVNFKAVGEKNQTVELYDGNDKSVGIMLDDGLNGDIKKDDGIYTLSVSIVPQIGKKYRYYAKGAVLSNNIEISTFSLEAFLSETELADDILSHIQDIADEYVISDSEEDTLQSAVSTFNSIYDYVIGLKKNKRIIDCHFDGLSVTIDLPMRSLFYTFEVDPKLLSGSDNVELNIISTFEPDKKQFNTTVYDDAAKTIDEAFKSYSFSNDVDNDDVTLDLLTSLSDNRVIIWNGHGGYSIDHASYLILPFPTHLVYGAEHYVTSEYVKYINDFKNGFLIDGGDKIGVTGNFFTHYYTGDNKFNNTLFYIGACAGAYDEYLCECLLDAGARTVLAYDEIVQDDYNEAICEDFFNNLVKKSDNPKETITAGEAYTRAKQSNTGSHIIWDAVYFYNSVLEKVKSNDKEQDLHSHADFVIFGDKNFRLSDYDPEPEDPEPEDCEITEDDSPEEWSGRPVDYVNNLFDSCFGYFAPGRSKFENNVPESNQLVQGSLRYVPRIHDSSLDEFDEQGRLVKITYAEEEKPNRYLSFTRVSDYRFDGSYIATVYNHLAGVSTEYYTYDPNSKVFLRGYWNFEYDNHGRLKRLFAEPGYYYNFEGEDYYLYAFDEMVFSYEESNNSLYRKYCAYMNGEKLYSGKVQIINSKDGTTLVEKKIFNKDGKLHEYDFIIPNSFNGQSIRICGQKIEDGSFSGDTFSYDERGYLTRVGRKSNWQELFY